MSLLTTLKIVKLKAGSLRDIQSVTILGSPRSGTTWLQEMLTYAIDATPIFEPFHVSKGVISIDEYPGMDQGIDDSIIDALLGHSNNEWTVSRMKLSQDTSKRVVKSVRLMPSLEEVAEKLSSRDERKPIVIFRDPIETVCSQYGLFGDVASEYVLEKQGVESKGLCLEERMIIRWKIENLKNLSIASQGKFHAVSYSNLSENPVEVVTSLLSLLKFSSPRSVNQLERFSQRRSTSPGKGKASVNSLDADRLLTAYRKHLLEDHESELSLIRTIRP